MRRGRGGAAGAGRHGAAPARRKLARLARREAHVWQRADGYVTITAGLAQRARANGSARAPRLAVIPDGTRIRHASRTIAGAGNAGDRRLRRSPLSRGKASTC